MTRSEAARFLNIPEATLARWVRQGLLQSADGHGERFERFELERWARERGLPLSTAAPARATPPQDLLAAAIQRGAVTANVKPATASEAIEIAVNALEHLDEAARRLVVGEVLERERMASTGLGDGFALPHPRAPMSDLIHEPVVSVVFPDAALDWAALDGEPVSTVFLLLSPSSPVHLQILSRIAHGLRSSDLPSFLRTRPSQAKLVERLRDLGRGE